MNRYTLRRWWRRFWRRLRRGPQRGAGPGPVVQAFLEGASARECAYRFWHRGASAELATAADWPEAVALVEATIRDYVEQLQAEQAEGGKS